MLPTAVVEALLMPEGFAATASIEVASPAAHMWAALTEPALVKQYFFGTDLSTNRQVGCPMTFRGV